LKQSEGILSHLAQDLSRASLTLSTKISKKFEPDWADCLR